MTAETTIKLLMKVHKVSNVTMAKMLGLARESSVRSRLNNGNITSRNMIQMLDIMGYEVIVREKVSGRRRDDEIIITLEDEVEI